MRIVVDFDDPNNDLDVYGLPEDTEPGSVLGRDGVPVWRLFSAATRLLFLAKQDSDVARQALERELAFIEQRIRELKPNNPPRQNPSRGRR
jgi:hypothetical protein